MSGTTMPRKILIIDDDPDMGEYICAAASQMGLECHATVSVDEFLSICSGEISLLFIDLIMPQVDGVELLRHLAERGCATPIVLMSGVGMRVMETAEDLAGALGLTIAGKLQKPFPHGELRSLLRRPLPVLPLHRVSSYTEASEMADADLLAAIEQDQFVVHYQPQIEIETGQIAGLEALVRWQHPEAGLLFPDRFISRLEALGQIDALGWLVARRAFSECGIFADDDGNMPNLSLNCSVESLLDLQFPDRLLDTAAQYRIPAERLVLEITESGLLRELAKTLDVLARLRMRGVQLSIDDFGTGYSMMRQLRHVPATEIKVDRFFVQNLDSCQGDRIILRKTIEMGTELGLRVVAEGVETRNQLEFLRDSGCDVAQGYLFSKPLPAVELYRWLNRTRRESAAA